MSKVINLIKSENLLNHLPLEIEDIICDYLKEHPAEFKKELKQMLEPFNFDESWKKDKWNKIRVYNDYKQKIKDCIRTIKHCKDHQFYFIKNKTNREWVEKYEFIFMKFYDKNKTYCKCDLCQKQFITKCLREYYEKNFFRDLFDML
jgi:hypothetical protein